MLKKNLLTIASLTGMAFLPLAQAEDQIPDDRWYVAPFASFVHTGGDRGADDGWGAGLGVGKMLDRHFNVELRGFYNEFEGYAKNQFHRDWELAGGTADVQYFFMRDTFSPYVVAGVGGMNTNGLYNRSAVGIIAETGLGFTYEILDNFLLRSDVRYRFNNNFGAEFGRTTDTFHDMVVNVGFVIPFGDKPSGMPQAEAPIPVAQAVDCSTLDSDADGINDCLDQCPGTIKGSNIDNSGCPVRLVLKGQHFNYDSAELTLTAQGLLDEVAASLVNYPQKNDIEVQGHASSEGADNYNMRLSQRRSESVVEYLKSKGVTNKLIARGYGETQPIADNGTEAGKAENRRVELIWITD